jgi:uncharacterized protein (DUF58 family)
MIRRPTTKAGIIVCVGVLLLAVGTTAQAGWLFVLSAGVLGLVLSGVFTWHRLRSVTVTRSLPARARVGEDVAVTLSVHNAANKRLPVMRVEDTYPAFGELAIACESVPRGAVAGIELQRVAVRRGVFEGAEVTLSTAAPFGVMRTRRTTAVPSHLIVHPAITDVSGFPLPETAAVTADEALAVARSGAGEVFAGVRDYRPGDQRRWIHWRTTARTGRLAVREQEEPARSPVVLVVAGLGADDGAERVASAAASIGLYALDRGRPVHCVGRGRFGERVENATRLQLLDWAAALEPSDSTPEEAVAEAFRRWGRRCSFVLFQSEPGFSLRARQLAERRGAAVEVVIALSQEQRQDAEQVA